MKGPRTVVIPPIIPDIRPYNNPKKGFNKYFSLILKPVKFITPQIIIVIPIAMLIRSLLIVWKIMLPIIIPENIPKQKGINFL